MNIFDINYILFHLPGYDLSAVEFIGTVSGMLCVIYAARGRVISWPLGILNAIFFFVLFYQARLYSSMILQVYYLVTSIIGWYRWTHPRHELETDTRDELKVSRMNPFIFGAVLAFTFIISLMAGACAAHLHSWLPFVFPAPAAYPYLDSLISVFSITAQVFLMLKKNENWMLWVVVDTCASVMYFMTGVYMVAIEYVIFGIIAAAGLWNWRRIMNSYRNDDSGFDVELELDRNA